MSKLNAWDEADLRWYFSDSDGALGAQSGHGPMVAAAMGARGSGVASSWNAILVADHRMADVVRERRVRAAVGHLPVTQARVLELVYGPRRACYGDAETKLYFGRALPIAHFTFTAVHCWPHAPGDAFTAWLSNLFAAKGSPTAAAMLRAMRQEGEAMLEAAEEAYVAGKAAVRRERATQKAEAWITDLMREAA